MMTATDMRTFRTRYPGKCSIHGEALPLGTLVHSPERGVLICHACYNTGQEVAAPVVEQSQSSFAPTAEQLEALELFKSGDSLAIEAGAGTGKTSTLKLLAESTTRRGQYIAFNKAIVVEAGEKMPRNVTCSTAHSLAFRAIAINTPFVERMKSGKRMRSLEIANRLGLDPINVGDKHLSRSLLAGLVMESIKRFCQTVDPEPSRKHVPYIDGIDGMLAEGKRDYTNNNLVAAELEEHLATAWADLSNPHGELPFTTSIAMAVYLKLWQLSEPKINAEFILFDEAQDANPVMVDVVRRQTHAQIVWVGDSQQQIYTFTGAVNALASVGANQRAFLTQSFRFGPAVAQRANVVLSLLEAELRITGTDAIPSVVGPILEPDVILSRTNAAAVREVLSAQAAGRSVHLVGGSSEIVAFAKAASQLINDERTDHPELACFESWNEVETYVAQDQQGSELRLLVKLVNDFGVETILAALDKMIREEDADLVVSTAHKSKGREWNSVQLAGDFPPEPQGEELRLLYVALTRARRELDLSNVLLFNEEV